MTGPKGNSKFCFPETLNVSRGEAEENIEIEGKQNLLFPYQSREKKLRKIRLLYIYAGWLTNLPQLQGAIKKHAQDLITCDSKVHVVVSLKEFYSPPIGKRICVGRYNKTACSTQK